MDLLEAFVRVLVSGVLVWIGFHFAMGSDATLQKVGVGFIGTVAGYWLR